MGKPAVRHNLADLVQEILLDTPILTISRAHQVGKTTLVLELVKNRPARVADLDGSVTPVAAWGDPDAFVRQYPLRALAINEIRHAPELFRAIKEAPKKDRRPDRFTITISSNLSTLKDAGGGLAGRTETLYLRGFSQGERLGFVEDFARFAWNLTNTSTLPGILHPSRSEHFTLLITSVSPEIVNTSRHRQGHWVDAYTERILSKDTSGLFGIQHPDRLTKLLSLTTRNGTSEFVAAHVARELDLPERSLPSYLEALKSIFPIDALPAWGRNPRRRAISKPRVFAQNLGLAAVLAGVDSRALKPRTLSSLCGGLMESFVTTEPLEQRTWSTKALTLSHLRTSTGQEVDFILEDRQQSIIGIEVKAAMSISRKDFKGLSSLHGQIGDQSQADIVLHTDKQILPMGDHLWATPISTS